MRSFVVALAAFGLLTLAVFRPTPFEMAHTSPAYRGDAGDAMLYMWAIDHVSRRLLTDPLRLFEPGIFFPAHHTLAYSDHMIGQAVLGLPVWFLTRGPLLEFNVLCLASYAFAAAAMFVYARDALGGLAPAAVAAVVFAFTPLRFHSPLWPQVLWSGFMPLALLFWRRFVLDLRWRDWAAWVACWVAHSLMGMYLTLYFGITMGVLGLWALVAAPTRRSPRLRAGIVLAPVVALALLAPTLWPYVVLRTTQGLIRPAGLDTYLSFFLPGPGTVTGWLAGLAGPARFGPGLAVSGLAVLGLVSAWRGAGAVDAARRFSRGAHAIGLLVTLLLILVPIHVQLKLPFLDMVRNTNRAFHVALIFVGMFAGEAVAWLASGRGGTVVAGALVALVLADMGRPPRERKTLPTGAAIPAAYRWLRDLPDDAPLSEGVQGMPPAFVTLWGVTPMYYATIHGKPLALGYSGFTSPGAAYVALQLSRFPESTTLELLSHLGIRHVLWHFPDDAVADGFVEHLPDAVRVAARFGPDVVFAVQEPPERHVAPAVVPLSRDGWRLDASDRQASLEAVRDGDPRTAWAVQGGDPKSAPWLQVDLGATQPVAGLRARIGDPAAPGVYLTDVETSVDGSHWERLDARFRPDSLPTLIDRPRDLRSYTLRDRTRPARYVRLRNPAITLPGWRWEMSELDVLADCDAAPLPECPTPAPSPQRSQSGARPARNA
jgi:hypothetical protein